MRETWTSKRTQLYHLLNDHEKALAFVQKKKKTASKICYREIFILYKEINLFNAKLYSRTLEIS